MADNRKLSALPIADGLNNDDMILVTQAGLSKRSTVAEFSTGVLNNVVFQQEATEAEALEGVTSDTVMTARRVKDATEDFKNFIVPIEGREYLGAFYEALIEGDDPIPVLISGDSTTRGDPHTTNPYTPQTLMANLARRLGVTGPVFTALGRSGGTSADWLSTYLTEDLTYAPKLYIWHWGLNDPFFDITADQTLENLQAGLATIRATYDRDEMAILILTPNMSDHTDGGRTPEWFAEVNANLRQAAREYECAFIDIYTPWKNADATMMYTEMMGWFVHPGPAMSAVTWGLVADTIYPLALRKPQPPVVVDLVKKRHVTASTWLSSDGGTTTSYRDVCWARELGLFVAVGLTGAATSPDGVTWTDRTAASADNWQAVAYSPELRRVVAVASNGAGSRAMSSDDGGVTWTSRTAASASQWVGVCWSPERRLFAAVGNGVIMTSPDGITWTARTSPAANFWNKPCWSREQGMFVAVASSGTGNRAMYSYDGISWATSTTPSDISWVTVRYGEGLGLFVAVANASGGNNVMTSPDGITWTLQAGHANNLLGLTFYEELGLFVTATSATAFYVLYSADGITWTSTAAPASKGWQALTVAPELGLVCAVSSDTTTANVMTSVSAHSFAYRS